MIGSLACACGGCLPCRISRRRVWAHRILLESLKHGDNCFVTLTYSDDTVPNELVRSHYQLFLKRLRRALSPVKVRYFVAGEYGELSGRPHFHMALFGVDRYVAGGADGKSGAVKDAWGFWKEGKWYSFGFVSVGTLSWESAQYIAGYLTKKVKVDERSCREFSRMSLRPGIGSFAMDDVARVLSCDVGLDSVYEAGDVLYSLSHGKRMLPLGRYLRRQLRGKLGFASKDTPVEAVRLFVLRSSAEAAASRESLKGAGFKSWEADKVMLDIRKQKIKDMESRFRVRDSERSLK